MIWGFPLSAIIYCSTAHFIMGFSVGLLVYYLMRITSRRITSVALSRDLFTGWRFGWLVVSLSIIAHVLEDFFIKLF